MHVGVVFDTCSEAFAVADAALAAQHEVRVLPCGLAFQAYGDTGLLEVESTCIDDRGETIVVQRGSSRIPWRPDELVLTTAVTTSCGVETQARCYSPQ